MANPVGIESACSPTVLTLEVALSALKLVVETFTVMSETLQQVWVPVETPTVTKGLVLVVRDITPVLSFDARDRVAFAYTVVFTQRLSATL